MLRPVVILRKVVRVDEGGLHVFSRPMVEKANYLSAG